MPVAPKKPAHRSRRCSLCWVLLLLLLTLEVLTSCNLSANCFAPEMTTAPEMTAPATTIPEPPETEAMALPADTDATPPPEDNWMLTLVNPWNPIDPQWKPRLLTLSNGLQVDERCYPDLQAMMDDCRAAGYSPLICSAYRAQETQQQLYEAKVSQLLPQLGNLADAEAEAAMVVARPGTSEHQLGLALDIVDMGYQLLDEGQEDTPVQQWLMDNSWKYGFILRYPLDKSHLTGIIYEPWHYRYVGLEAAREIHARGLCLEEYLSVQENGT